MTSLMLIVVCFALELAGIGPSAVAAFQNHSGLLMSVLDSIESGLAFMKIEHKQLNLDALIGTRLVEGQLGVLLQRVDDGDLSVSDDIDRRLRSLQNEADHVSNIGTPFVKLKQTTYYSRIGPLIDRHFWKLAYKSRDVIPQLVHPPRYYGEVMREKQSDDCLTELFGTSGKTKDRCRISRHCWELMTSPGYRYYSLSHEVFYLEIGESFQCFNGDFLLITDALNAGFCANMLVEAASFARANYPADRQDLFMEHQALCGILGYRQFFRQKWLLKILSWQRVPRGCWPDVMRESDAGSRRKREEKDLPDGCGCHRTSVAIGALVQYVRYIIEEMQH